MSPAMGTVGRNGEAYDETRFGAAFSVPCVKRPDLLSGLSFVRMAREWSIQYQEPTRSRRWRGSKTPRRPAMQAIVRHDLIPAVLDLQRQINSDVSGEPVAKRHVDERAEIPSG